MAVAHDEQPPPADDVILRTAHADHGTEFRVQGSGGRQGLRRRRGAVHAFGHFVRRHHGHDLRGVGPDDSGSDRLQKLPRRPGPVGGCPGADGIENDGDAQLPGPARRQEHGLRPLLAQGADVDHQGGGDSHHILHLLVRVGHDGGSTDGQQGVGGGVHHHIVGNVMNQRSAGSDPFQVLPDIFRPVRHFRFSFAE